MRAICIYIYIFKRNCCLVLFMTLDCIIVVWFFSHGSNNQVWLYQLEIETGAPWTRRDICEIKVRLADDPTQETSCRDTESRPYRKNLEFNPPGKTTLEIPSVSLGVRHHHSSTQDERPKETVHIFGERPLVGERPIRSREREGQEGQGQVPQKHGTQTTWGNKHDLHQTLIKDLDQL